MDNKEAYELGRSAGLKAKMGLMPAISTLPEGISPHTPQAAAFHLGYHDTIKGRTTLVRRT